jgi:uncharacterized C2H2 Zn-finger protein
MSSLDTSFSDFRRPIWSSESRDSSEETINTSLKESGNEEDDLDHIRSLSDKVEPGPASEAAAEDQNFPIQEMNTLGGQVEFCESPTSISGDMDLKKVGLKIDPHAAIIGAFAESSVLASRQASYTSNAYTLEIPVDLYLHRQPCLGILKLQPPDLQLSSPSNQHSVPFESSSCDRSASISDCLDLQRLNLLRGPSSPKLLEILNSQSGKLEGLMPSGLLEHLGRVFESTTEQSLRKLNELKESEFGAVVGPVYRIKLTLDTGLSALKSLVIGQVPNRLNGVMSLLSIAHSIVTMLVDEQNQVQFREALFLDAIEWTNAIDCREEQDAFEMLLQYLWLPEALSSVCSHGHRWSSRVWRSFRPTRTQFERIPTPLEEGLLDGETENGFRLRTGLNAQICQWYIDCEYRLWPPTDCNINRGSDFHRTCSLHHCREPYSPANYWVGTPPSFEESVRRDLLRPCTEHISSSNCHRALDTLRHELDSGQISTFDEVASLVNSQMSKLEPELALSAPIFSIRCRGAQAIYNSQKVGWLRDEIRRAANLLVSPGCGGDVDASHPPFANADRHILHELNGLPDAHSLPMDHGTASFTPSATSRTRERKRRRLCKDTRRYAPDGEVSQITKCPQCEQTFSGIASDQKSNLNRHLEHKHPHPRQASLHVCPECGEDFRRSDYLLKHKRHVHGFS